jgi:thioredoxin-like negative regulator of GroEL
MAPLVERLKQEYAGKVEFRKYVDSGDPVGDQLSQQFNVQYVPTFVFVNADGSLSGQPIVGGVDEAALRQRLDVLKQAPAPTTKKK